jgi:hypothetical protein
LGEAYLLQAHVDEAIVWLEKARNLSPALALFRAYLASAYALKGDVARAAGELVEARKLDGASCCSSIASLKGIEDFGVPSRQGRVRNHSFRRPAQGRNTRAMSHRGNELFRNGTGIAVEQSVSAIQAETTTQSHPDRRTEGQGWPTAAASLDNIDSASRTQ